MPKLIRIATHVSSEDLAKLEMLAMQRTADAPPASARWHIRKAITEYVSRFNLDPKEVERLMQVRERRTNHKKKRKA